MLAFTIYFYPMQKTDPISQGVMQRLLMYDGTGIKTYNEWGTPMRKVIWDVMLSLEHNPTSSRSETQPGSMYNVGRYYCHCLNKILTNIEHAARDKYQYIELVENTISVAPTQVQPNYEFKVYAKYIPA